MYAFLSNKFATYTLMICTSNCFKNPSVLESKCKDARILWASLYYAGDSWREVGEDTFAPGIGEEVFDEKVVAFAPHDTKGSKKKFQYFKCLLDLPSSTLH